MVQLTSFSFVLNRSRLSDKKAAAGVGNADTAHKKQALPKGTAARTKEVSCVLGSLCCHVCNVYISNDMLMPTCLVTPCAGTNGYSLRCEAENFEESIQKFKHFGSEASRQVRLHFSEKHDEMHVQEDLPRSMMMDLGVKDVFSPSTGNLTQTNLIPSAVWCDACQVILMKTSCPQEMTMEYDEVPQKNIVDFASKAFLEATGDLLHPNQKKVRHYTAVFRKHCSDAHNTKSKIPTILHSKQLNGKKKAIEEYNNKNPAEKIGYETFKKWCNRSAEFREAYDRNKEVALNGEDRALFWESQLHEFKMDRDLQKKKRKRSSSS